MDNETMLTTVDNPYNPFKDFILWFLYDEEKGYKTCSLLGRTTKLSDDMSQKEIDEAIDKAMDDIIKYDFLDMYKKVTDKDFESDTIED